MIPIDKNYNSKLIDWHYQAIRNYLDGRRMKAKFANIESLIAEFTNGKYSFETLLKASFNEIEDIIIPAWRNFTPTRRAVHVKSIRLFKTLYLYLGHQRHYKFKEGRKTIYYNTNFLFSHFSFNVCPYCNENYTYYFSKSGKRNYDLDHFYNKADFPILAISFFNLIPSCKVCNFFKNKNPIKILSPHYIYKINDALEWGIKIKSASYLYDENQFEIILVRTAPKGYLSRIKNNIRVFKLQDRYAHRKDIVMDTLRRKQVYSEDYITQLFGDFEGRLFKNVEDVKSLIYNANMAEDDFNKRPFSKLIRDVFYGKH